MIRSRIAFCASENRSGSAIWAPFAWGFNRRRIAPKRTLVRSRSDPWPRPVTHLGTFAPTRSPGGFSGNPQVRYQTQVHLGTLTFVELVSTWKKELKGGRMMCRQLPVEPRPPSVPRPVGQAPGGHGPIRSV